MMGNKSVLFDRFVDTVVLVTKHRASRKLWRRFKNKHSVFLSCFEADAWFNLARSCCCKRYTTESTSYDLIIFMWPDQLRMTESTLSDRISFVRIMSNFACKIWSVVGNRWETPVPLFFN